MNITLPEEFTIPSLFNFMVEVMVKVFGLTWDKLLEAFKEVVQTTLGINIDRIQERIKEVTDLWTAFHDAGDNLDLGKGIRYLYDKILGEIRPAELLDILIKKATSWLVTTVVTGALEWVASLAIPGAAVLKLIFQGAQWLVAKAKVVTAFLQKLIDAYDAPKTGGKEQVAAKIVELLKSALPLVFSVIAAVLGVGSITTTIKGIAKDLQAKIWEWIKAGLKWLVEKIKELIQQVFGKGGGKGDCKCGCPPGGPTTTGPAKTGPAKTAPATGAGGMCFGAAVPRRCGPGGTGR